MSESNTSPSGNCRFAVPKKGRTYEKVLEMLKGADIQFHRAHRLDVATCTDLPITLVFLPASDIPHYVGEGNVDIGICGIDHVEETSVEVDRIMELGFGKCKLCVQAPVADNIRDSSDLAGKRIVTSFPELTKRFFKPFDEAKGVKTKVKFVSGSVEAACGLGLADGVVDLVETGTTMRAAGLEVVETVLSTQFVLIGNPHAEHQDIVDLLKRRISGYITSQKYVLVMYNISNDLFEKAVAITPGKKSPTVTSLEDGNSKAVSALILKKDVSKKMDELYDAGATDILVLSMSNSLM